MRDDPKTRTQVACVVTITSRPLRDNRNYQLYSIAIDGQVVREQISAPGAMEVQTECDRLRVAVPPEWRGEVKSQPPGRAEIRQATLAQQQQSQARASLYSLLDGAQKLPPVVPVVARGCQSCGGTGSRDIHFEFGTNTSETAPCTRCGGTGSVMVPA